MKAVRHAVVIVIVCAVASAVTTGAQESKQGSAPLAPQDAREQRDEGRVDALQRAMKKLSEDNAALRAENAALRLRVEEAAALVRRLQENGGILRVPPEALRAPNAGQGQVPPNWKPFEFNGATYYVIPLNAGKGGVDATVAK
jgi:hypothetical protein